MASMRTVLVSGRVGSYTAGMEMTLTPEVQERLERRLQDGRWRSASEVLETALDFLDDMDEEFVLSRDELDAKLERSMAAAARGETISAEQAQREIAKLRESL
jgi:Arc/MetJ-type ribon-helix-helix transcriptional regulator